MNSVIIGLGSNIDPEKNINTSRLLLKQHYRVLAESNFVTTKPFGYFNQPNFINGAVLIETEKNQDILKEELKQMEQDLGRQTSNFKYGPRTIDLDIIIWNQSIIDQDVYQRDYLRNSIDQLIPGLLDNSNQKK